MACAAIDTEGLRFRVITVTGYLIGTAAGGSRLPGVSATVLGTFYGTEHGTFAAWDYIGRGGRRGSAGALAAAADRCAELNAWHEREGWGG